MCPKTYVHKKSYLKHLKHDHNAITINDDEICEVIKNKHLKTQTNKSKKIYMECHICHKIYKGFGVLKQHIRVIHGNFCIFVLT